jgi:hypothetical protein
MTRADLLEKIQTQEGKREIAEEIASVWWHRMELSDIEEWYNEATVNGVQGLMACSVSECLEHAEDVDLLEEVDEAEAVVSLTIEEFVKWTIDGKINGVHYDDQTIFEALQKRLWECPECRKENVIYRKELSYEDIIEVGTPMCPEGHLMELIKEGDE